MTINTLDSWHQLLVTQNANGLKSLIADNAVFHSPVVHTPQVGKALTMLYLGAAFKVFYNDSFRYVRELVGPTDAIKIDPGVPVLNNPSVTCAAVGGELASKRKL